MRTSAAGRLTLVLHTFHFGPWDESKIDTITDVARRGYDAKITCAGCGHVSHWNAIELADELSRRRKPLRIEAVELIMRCRACGKRGAIIQPVEQF